MPGHTQRLVKFCRLEKEAGKMLEENKSVPVSFFAERKCTRQRSWLMSTLLGVVILCGPSVADAANRVLYYHNDTLGSPVAMTDSSGTIVWQPIISRSMI